MKRADALETEIDISPMQTTINSGSVHLPPYPERGFKAERFRPLETDTETDQQTDDVPEEVPAEAAMK